MKHISIRYHFIKYAVSENVINLIKIDEELNLTDDFIKVISFDKFSKQRTTLKILQQRVRSNNNSYLCSFSLTCYQLRFSSR